MTTLLRIYDRLCVADSIWIIYIEIGDQIQADLLYYVHWTEQKSD